MTQQFPDLTGFPLIACPFFSIGSMALNGEATKCLRKYCALWRANAQNCCIPEVIDTLQSIHDAIEDTI